MDPSDVVETLSSLMLAAEVLAAVLAAALGAVVELAAGGGAAGDREGLSAREAGRWFACERGVSAFSVVVVQPGARASVRAVLVAKGWW